MTVHVLLNLTIEMKATGLTVTGKYFKEALVYVLEKDDEAFPRHKALDCLTNWGALSY